jgi:pyruvate kinase
MIDDFSKSVQTVRELNIPLATVALLTGISSGSTSMLFSGQRPCDNVTAARIWKSVSALKRLKESVEPLPIDFRRAEALKQAIKKIEEQGEQSITVGEITDFGSR